MRVLWSKRHEIAKNRPKMLFMSMYKYMKNEEMAYRAMK